MATTLITWTGRSGTLYETEAFPIGTTFNSVSGVYILCYESPVGRWWALYVGEAQSLYDRLNANVSAHDGFERATGRGATHIAVVRTRSDAERLRIETDLRHGLNPVCNRQAVPAVQPLVNALRKR